MNLTLNVFSLAAAMPTPFEGFEHLFAEMQLFASPPAAASQCHFSPQGSHYSEIVLL